MDIDEKVRLLGMGYTHEICDAIDAARVAQATADKAAERASGRKRTT